jgi:hypothetical protein
MTLLDVSVDAPVPPLAMLMGVAMPPEDAFTMFVPSEYRMTDVPCCTATTAPGAPVT